MKKLVIDSCVFAKLFLDEEDEKIASELFNSILDNKTKIVVPQLFYYEIIGIAKKNKIKLSTILEILTDYEESLLEYVKPAQKILKLAFEVTDNGNKKSGFPSIYDALYHALAINNNCDFITADHKYYQKTKHLGHIQLLHDLNF